MSAIGRLMNQSVCKKIAVLNGGLASGSLPSRKRQQIIQAGPDRQLLTARSQPGDI